MKIFISKKKLIKLIKDTQQEIRYSNEKVKEMYMNKEKAVQWQYYIDGNDNAFNCLLGKIERR